MNNGNNNLDKTIILNAAADALYFNCPNFLQIRVGLSALRQSVAKDLLAAVLSFLSQTSNGFETIPFVRSLLQRIGITSQTGQDFGVTNVVNDWLSDNSGNFLFDAVRRAHRRAGIDAARQVITAWRESNRRENESRATVKTEEILAELDKVKTLANHRQILSGIIVDLNFVRQSVELASVEAGNRLQDLENRLQVARSNAQNSSAPAAIQIRWNDFRGHFNNVRNRLFGSNQNITNSGAVPTGGANFLLEHELLSVFLDLATLEAEQSLIAEICNSLEDERQADEDVILLLNEGATEAAREARLMETTRKYGMAGGELLLNSPILTGSVMSALFGSAAVAQPIETLATTVLNRFAESHQSVEALRIIASRQTTEINSTILELTEICQQITDEKMLGFTVSDALAILLRSGDENWQNKLTTVFGNTVAPNFLAANYDKFLDLQTFATVVYPKGILPEGNELLLSVLSKIKQDIGVNFDIKVDDTAKDRLLFYCEYFCVPLDAVRFYEENQEEFESVKNHPRYNPHSMAK